MKSIDEISDDFLERLFDNKESLIETIKLEVKDSIDKIISTNEDLYGYAILPGDWYEVGTLAAAYNIESDIKTEELEDPIYYRYSVDEWENYDHSIFQKSNAILKPYQEELQKILNIYEDNYDEETTDLKSSFADFIYASTLTALFEYRKEPANYSENIFLAIWVADSSNEIVDQSIMELNPESVSKLFFSYFSS
jgi:Domain of unknown function (DUF4303)